MVYGQLRVAVIGSQTQNADSSLGYTLYRTAVNYRGVCYHRLIRYRHFLSLAKKLKVAPGTEPLRVRLPSKLWSRKASLRPEVVEARQVLLNEFVQQLCTRELTKRSEQRLLRLLQVGDYDTGEADKAGGHSMSKQPSIAPTERTSDALEFVVPAESTQTTKDEASVTTTVETTAHRPSMDDELLRHEEPVRPTKGGCETEEPAGIDTAERFGGHSRRADSLPPSPSEGKRLEKVRPASMSLTKQNMKRVMFEEPVTEQGSPESKDSSNEMSTAERRYTGEILKLMSSIEGTLDSSRKMEHRIREKQASSETPHAQDGPLS